MRHFRRSEKLRLALRASLLGSGSTSWMTPRRRWLARLAIMLSAVCLGLGVGLALRSSDGKGGILPLCLGVGMACLGFLIYDVIMGVEILEKRGYEAEMGVANEIQARLFPRVLPSGDGLSVAAYHRPARAVGGDYYDVLPLGEGRYAVAVADVSGKGVPAAILMASVRTQIRVLAPRGLPPSVIATYMSEALYHDTEPSQYATLFYGVIDLNEGIVTYVNAGHVPPFIINRMGSRQRLEVGGVPVGLFPGARYEQGQEFFAAGDRLVLYTDGVADAGLDEGLTLDSQELERIATDERIQPVNKLLGSILDRVEEIRGDQEQIDDITVLIVGVDAA